MAPNHSRDRVQLARRARAKSHHVKHYQRQPDGFFRRWRRCLVRPLFIGPLVALFLVGLGVLAVYWADFSGRIDNSLLNGDVFTRTSGIYAAPREIKPGQKFSSDDLINQLKRAGYVEESQQADSARGRYQISPNSVDVKPGADAKIDNALAFPRLRVQFDKTRASITALNDLTSGASLNKATLEPELLSSVAGQERAKRKVISFQDLPQHFIRAVTVTEDRAFFEHRGINVRGIVRAFLRRYDIDPNSPLARQGGSSITQQLVKNLWLSPEQTWKRKAAEAYMSIILETRLTKEEIFTLYCNQIYLGQQGGFSINGVGQGAQAYFGKDVSALSLPESAFLAGIIRSPNRYNPLRDPQRASARRNQVLDSMMQAGAITRELGEQAKKTPLQLAQQTRPDQSEAPYFADYIESQLEPLFAGTNTARHLRVYTTLDMDLQRAAYNAVNKNLARLDKIFAKRVPPGTLQAALVAMNAKTGEIVAMVGGRDYNQSVFNRAADAYRQPGSAFKPFVYAAALDTAYSGGARIITPASTFKDEPKTFYFESEEYKPGNFGDHFSNQEVTLRDALVKSLNVVTVDVAMEVKIGRVMNLADKAGLTKPKKAYPAMALGTHEATPLQVASAYTAFANYGVRVSPAGVGRITDGNGITKKYSKLEAQREKVMGPDVAFVMTSFMQDVVNRGTAAKLRQRGFRYNVAGKTGTSRDGWFVGYSPGLVCAVYVGFDDGSELGLKGGDSALPIWADFMGAALAKHPEWQGNWSKPEGVQEADINPENGLLAKADDPHKRHEYFINNSAPTAESATLADQEELAAEGEPVLDEQVTAPQEDPEAEKPPGPPPKGGPRPPDPNAIRNEPTITLDIDPSTGLIAAPEVCPYVRAQTFIVGQEPRKRCGAAYHR